jgi:hypothetical protein
MLYTVHTSIGAIPCATLKLAARIRRELGGHVTRTRSARS